MQNYILTTPQPQANPVTIWSSPVSGPVLGALITVVLGGVFVKLWWELIESEKKRLVSEKESEIKRLNSEKESEIKCLNMEHQVAIKDKNLEISTIKAQYEDNIRDLNYELIQLKGKCYPSLEEDYEMLSSTFTKVNSQLKRDLRKTRAELAEKEQQIQELSSTDASAVLLNQLTTQKQELETRNKILEEYLETLDGFTRRMQVYQAASTWLAKRREELVNLSSEHVLKNNPQLSRGKTEDENIEFIRKFKDNIDDYIDWIRFSLERGRPVDLTRVKLKPVVPGFALAEAFKFIKKEKAAQELSDDIADELGSFTSTLIAYFSSSAFRQKGG